MPAIEEYIDSTGVKRRLGSFTVPHGFVSAFPPYENQQEMPLWDEATIRDVVSDPGRRDTDKVLPAEVYVTQQWGTSACNGWAAAGAVTAARKLSGIDDTWVGSGSWVYSFINGGRDQGSNLEDGMRTIQEKGVASQKIVTYDMIFPRQIPRHAREDAEKHKALKAYRALSKQGWDSGLAAGFVGVAAVHAGRAFDSQRDGVSGVVRGGGNHAVLILDIRWRNGQLQYRMSNSWGLRWGQKGRTWLTWDHFQQTFPNHVFYLVPTVNDFSESA